MASRGEQGLAAVVTALNAATAHAGAITKPTGFTAERSRVRHLEDADRANGWGGVYPIREITERESVLPQVNRRLRFKVSLRCASGDIYDNVIDPFRRWAVAAVMSDTTLGGLVVAVEEAGTEWVGEELNDYIPGCDIEFDMLYVTDEVDMESFG